MQRAQRPQRVFLPLRPLRSQREKTSPGFTVGSGSKKLKPGSTGLHVYTVSPKTTISRCYNIKTRSEHFPGLFPVLFYLQKITSVNYEYRHFNIRLYDEENNQQ